MSTRTRRVDRAVRVLASVVAIVAALPCGLGATCTPFPCDLCWIQSRGQLNLVVMDRENDRIQLVPNIRFVGNSPQLALVVPTPSLPELDPVNKAIWNELARMAAPARSQRGGDGDAFSCDGVDDVALEVGTGAPSTDVVVHSTETVGAFTATIVSSASPGALVAWLNENDFVIAPADSARFATYVQRDWYFTAMKLDTSDVRNQMPSNGWDAEVNPVRFTFDAAEFELPLPVLAINKAPALAMVMYFVDDHRAELDGFNTTYANELSRKEVEAFGDSYPEVSAYIAPGRFITRMERTFGDATTMSAPILLDRADEDEEVRTLASARNGWPAIELLLLGIPALILRWGARRRRARGPLV
jgi:hypothetical protein